MKRNTFRYLESITYEYHDMLKQIEEIELEILYDKNDDDKVQAGRTSVRNITDPTADRATALITDRRLARLRQKVNAVEKVFNSLIDDKQELIESFYWSNKNKNLTGLAQELKLTPRTAYRWRREFIIELGKVLGEI